LKNTSAQLQPSLNKSMISENSPHDAHQEGEAASLPETKTKPVQKVTPAKPVNRRRLC
jgi:hypothetical protein